MRSDGRRVYDCVTFFNELDLLELRLRELDDIVDVFVIAEANQTHAGADKPLNLQDNWDRFKPWHHKMEYIMVDLAEIGGVWFRENFQRSTTGQAASGYYDCHVTCLYEQENSKPGDVIGVFDLDEIPHPDTYEKFDPELGQCRVPMHMSYYYLNCRTENDGLWGAGTVFTHEEALKDNACMNGDIMRRRAADKPFVDCTTGWHFSYLGGAAKVAEKLAAYAHTEFAHLAKNVNHIEACLATGRDLFGRHVRYISVDVDDTFPVTIQENVDKYEEYLVGNLQTAEDQHPERLVMLPYCKGTGLDVGCGHRKTTPNCIGVDIVAGGQPGTVGCTAGQASQADVCASGDDLPFDDDSMDFVISRHNIEHYVDFLKTLQEWKRVLKPGGVMATITPDEEGLRRNGNRTINLDPTHEHAFTMDSFQRAIRLVGGLTVDKCEPVVENWSFICVCTKE